MQNTTGNNCNNLVFKVKLTFALSELNIISQPSML